MSFSLIHSWICGFILMMADQAHCLGRSTSLQGQFAPPKGMLRSNHKGARPTLGLHLPPRIFFPKQ